MDDLISRTWLLSEYDKRHKGPPGGARKLIEEAPSAQPKKGKWIEDKGQQILMQNFIERGEVWRVCSVCGAGHMIGHKYAIDKAYHGRHHNFCPSCGADMRGEQDDSV